MARQEKYRNLESTEVPRMWVAAVPGFYYGLQGRSDATVVCLHSNIVISLVASYPRRASRSAAATSIRARDRVVHSFLEARADDKSCWVLSRRQEFRTQKYTKGIMATASCTVPPENTNRMSADESEAQVDYPNHVKLPRNFLNLRRRRQRGFRIVWDVLECQSCAPPIWDIRHSRVLRRVVLGPASAGPPATTPAPAARAAPDVPAGASSFQAVATDTDAGAGAGAGLGATILSPNETGRRAPAPVASSPAARMYCAEGGRAASRMRALRHRQMRTPSPARIISTRMPPMRDGTMIVEMWPGLARLFELVGSGVGASGNDEVLEPGNVVTVTVESGGVKVTEDAVEMGSTTSSCLRGERRG